MRHVFCVTLVLVLSVAYTQAQEVPFVEIGRNSIFSFGLDNTGGFLTAAFSPDGTKIVTGSQDKTACVWDAQSGKKLLTMQCTDWVYTARFSPDGKKIVTGCNYEETFIRVWNAESGEELHKLEGQIRNYTVNPFSPDGKIATVGSVGNGVRIWDTESGKELQKWERGDYRAFSPDGKKIAISRNSAVYICDVESGEELQKMEGDAFRVAFSPDGKKIVMNGDITNYFARVWDIESGEELQKLEGHTKFLNSVAFSSDGKKIVTTSKDETARIWDVESGKELHMLGNPNDRYYVTSLGIMIYGRLYASRAKIQFDDAVFSPDGKYALTPGNGADKTARIWEVESGKELHALRLYGSRTSIRAAFSPDGKKVVIYPKGYAGGKTVRIYDLSAMEKP